MKKIYTLLLASSVVLLSSFTLQKSNMDEVIGALRSGNSAELAKYFDDIVDLTLPDKSDSYSKAQAQLIIKDFFGNNNGVKGFEVEHKGDNPSGGHWCIGTLHSKSGTYRTNVFTKMRNGKEVVKEIRFQSIE